MTGVLTVTGFGCQPADPVAAVALVEALGADAKHSGRNCVGHGAVEVDVVDACGEGVEGRGE